MMRRACNPVHRHVPARRFASAPVAPRATSYRHGPCEIPLLGTSAPVSFFIPLGMTIGEAFDRTAKKHALRPALTVIHQNIRWNYAELQSHVNDVAKGFLELGVQKGDRVGIWSPNNSEWVLTQYAAAKVGAILVNVNPAYRPHELAHALRLSQVQYLVTAPSFKKSDYIYMLHEAIPELLQPNAAHKELKSAAFPDLKKVIRLGEAHTPGMASFEHIVKLGKRSGAAGDVKLQEVQQSCDLDEAINIQYTSGTTGFPKGATLSHNNILNNGYFVGKLQNLTHEDSICAPVPLYHCFGMVMANLAAATSGANVVYPSEAFEPGAVLQTIHNEKCTALYGVPTMFIAELEHPEFKSFNLRSLRTGVMAGSPCPVAVMKRVTEEMHMRDVTICYGMTETSPVSTQTRLDAPLERRVSTVGTVHPHLEVKIIDPNSGRTVPLGEAGEICTRGYSVMIKYWGDDKATKKVKDEMGWMHTGDLGTMDKEGYVNVVGRLKDMLIRGGENIYPREIEEFLYTHPAVSDVQVIGVPDSKYGEEVMAWVKLKPGKTATQDELKHFCKGKITHYKIPRYWKFVDAFPTTVTGKIQKFIMREQAVKELGLEAAAKVKTA